MSPDRSPSSQPDKHINLSELSGARHRAEILFGALSFGAALFLLSQIGTETTWVDDRPLVRQPAFWPVLAIIGMTIFGAFELWSTWRALRRRGDGRIDAEVLKWFATLEYLAWFLAYVWIVPVLGYLPTTIVFCATLAFRLGYRRRGVLLAAVLTGIGTVVLFKSILGVKIPGGMVYEYLPDSIRNAMIVYF